MLLPLLLNLGFAGGPVTAPPQPVFHPIPEQAEGGRSYYEVDEDGKLQKRLKEEEDILLFIKSFLKWV